MYLCSGFWCRRSVFFVPSFHLKQKTQREKQKHCKTVLQNGAFVKQSVGICCVLQCLGGLFRKMVWHNFFLHIFFLYILGSQFQLLVPSLRFCTLSGPISRDTFKGGWHSPKIAIPPLIHTFTHSMEHWDADLSPCHFATAHFLQRQFYHRNFVTTRLRTCVLNACLPVTSRPMNWRTLPQLPKYGRNASAP